MGFCVGPLVLFEGKMLVPKAVDGKIWPKKVFPPQKFPPTYVQSK